MPKNHDMEAENSSEKNLQHNQRIVELPLILTENLLCARYSAKQFICSFIESSQLSWEASIFVRCYPAEKALWHGLHFNCNSGCNEVSTESNANVTHILHTFLIYGLGWVTWKIEPQLQYDMNIWKIRTRWYGTSEKTSPNSASGRTLVLKRIHGEDVLKVGVFQMNESILSRGKRICTEACKSIRK